MNGRNAWDASEYPDYYVDVAIQNAAARWVRACKGTAKLDTLTMTVGSNVLPAFPSGFAANLAIDTYLTIPGFLIPPEINITTIEAVLQAQLFAWGWCTPGPYLQPIPQTSPPTGQPVLIGFSDQTDAITNTLADKAYVVNLWWYPLFTSWQPGSQGAWSASTNYQAYDVVSSGGSAYQCIQPNVNEVPPNAIYWQLLSGVTVATPTTLTTNLPDDQLAVVTQWGAPAMLQWAEPERSPEAKTMLQMLDQEAKNFAGIAASQRAPRVLYRQSPYQADGSWSRAGAISNGGYATGGY